MRSVMAVVLPALMIGVLVLIVIEIRQYHMGRRLISRRRFSIRMAGGVLLLGLMAAVFLGVYILGLGSPKGRPVLFLTFWLGCVAVAFVLMFLAVADMREVESHQTRREHQLWREIARLLAGKPPSKDSQRETPRGSRGPGG
jgi:hypothetical protein